MVLCESLCEFSSYNEDKVINVDRNLALKDALSNVEPAHRFLQCSLIANLRDYDSCFLIFKLHYSTFFLDYK